MAQYLMGNKLKKNRPYSLSDGDIIRIADYVLILEAVAPVYEQPETVFRIIDPSLFSRPRSPENISASNVANPVPEVVSEVPSPISPEVETPSPEVSEIPEVVATQPDDVIPENIIHSPEAVSEVPHDVSDEIGDLQALVAPEVITDAEEVEVPEVVETLEISSTLADDAIAAPENIIETPKEESIVPEATHDDVADFEAALDTESTFVQRRDTSAIPEATSNEDAELEAALEAEVTFVQPRDIFGEVSDEESTIPEATHNENEVVDLDTPVAEEVSSDFGEFVNVVTEEEEIQPQETSNQIQDINNELLELDKSLAAEDSADVDEVEPTFAVDETGSEVSETLTEPDNIVAEVVSNQDIDLSNTTTEETSVDVDDVVPVNEASDLADIQFLEITESEAFVNISQTDEEILEVEVTQYDETIEEIFEVEATQSDETIEEISEAEATQYDYESPEETNVSEPPQVIIERNIVLIAHESKKSELAQFVSQHQEFFSQSFTITWPSVSEILHQQAGITISQQTPAPISGGYQTIASLVGAGEILAVIFLRDLLQPQPDKQMKKHC